MSSTKTNKIIIFGIGLAAVIAGAASAHAQTAAPVLTPPSVTVGLGQTMTVNTQGSIGVYAASVDSSVASIVVTNVTQILVTGNQPGSMSASICYVGTYSPCTNLSITVQTSPVQALSFIPNPVSLSPGGSQAVEVSGGGGTYSISGNSNPAAATASLASTTISIYAVAAGATTITVCDQTSNCGTISVTVGSSSGSGGQSVTFSTTNPTLAIGQSMSITLSGGTTYVVFYNSNAEVVQASTSNNTLSLYGAKSGSVSLTICAAGGNCSQLSVTVGGGTTTTYTAPITTTQQTTVQQTVVMPTAITDTSSLLATIQSMQSQLAQLLQQIQSMASSLTQLTATVLSSTKQQTTGAVAGSSFFTQFLTVGSEGSEVTALQNLLTKIGFYSGQVTGYFGPLTETAVTAYQSARGISPLGYVGPSTRAALNAE